MCKCASIPLSVIPRPTLVPKTVMTMRYFDGDYWRQNHAADEMVQFEKCDFRRGIDPDWSWWQCLNCGRIAGYWPNEKLLMGDEDD